MPSEEGLAAETLDQASVFGPEHDITVGDREGNFTAHPDSSTHSLSPPNQPDINTSEPSSEKVWGREPILNEQGKKEWYIDKIVDERRMGRGKQYLVSWSGFGPEDDSWLAGSALAENQALDLWEGKKKLANAESAAAEGLDR
jgi:hypothetical protein